MRLAASSIVTKQPSAVASFRPAEPPSGIGLPVTTPSVEYPCVIENVSMIHAMCCGVVYTSGAGMSRSWPRTIAISDV